MRIFDLFKMGLRNLFRRKARTLLTVIGVIIGTVSIVIMVSVGVGVNKAFEESVMQNGGMTTIYVSSNQYEEDENGNWTNTKQKLDNEAIELLKGVEHVRSVSPYLYCWAAKLYCGKYSAYPSILVIDMDCYEDFGYPPLEDGTYPTKETSQDSMYFGSQAIENMGDFYYWDGKRSMTKTVDFEKDKLTLGFEDYQTNPKKKPFQYQLSSIKKIAASESGYSEADWYVIMDYDMYKNLYSKYANTLKIDDRKKAMAQIESFEQILINVDSMDNVTKVQDAIEQLGYKSSSNMQYIEPMLDTANMLELVLGAIGAIAMLVSAINIANTMIMSIYERTKEIGIMKVLGCKVGDIRRLFLFEAGMIGLMGGIIGIGISYVGSWLINKYGGGLFESLIGTGTTEMAISYIPFWLPFGAAAFALAVGVLSGFFPAMRATRISAIEAMKNE